MKNAIVTCGPIAVLLAVFMMPAITFLSCTGGAAASGDSGAVFNDVKGKEWVLTEIRSAGNTVLIDRKKYEADNMENYFTISFNDSRVNGVGAPNRYFGPYTIDSGRKLTLGNMASTLMAAFKEPDELKEYRYYGYLSDITRWDLRNGKLELYSSNSAGAEVVLVYTSR